MELLLVVTLEMNRFQLTSLMYPLNKDSKEGSQFFRLILNQNEQCCVVNAICNGTFTSSLRITTIKWTLQIQELYLLSCFTGN